MFEFWIRQQKTFILDSKLQYEITFIKLWKNIITPLQKMWLKVFPTKYLFILRIIFWNPIHPYLYCIAVNEHRKY